jgi:hypothetical protein
MDGRFAAVALLALGAGLSIPPAVANSESTEEQSPAFTALQDVQPQPLSSEEMQMIAGLSFH